LEKEKVFRNGFEELQRQYPDIITEIRGRGLMLGVQLDRDPAPVVTAARERGLLVLTAGVNTLRFVPPLTITKEQIEQGLAILADAMKAVCNIG
jgi:acetylornithine aminotransferase